MICNILFDLDGTLTDPKEGITKCIQEALSKLGRPVLSSDELEWCIGPGLYGSFEKLLDSRDPKLIQKAIDLYRQRYTKKGIFENYVYPGIIDTLNELKKMNLRLFVATSKPTVFAKQVMVNHHLDGFFEGIYGIELNGEKSDKGELISFLLRSESLIDKQTLMIGDREHDIIGAKHNNIYAGGVLYGYGTKQELTQAGADYLFIRPLDIVDCIAQNRKGTIILKLAFCGDDCNACPRYMATQSGDVESLKEVAAMWKRAGWREKIVPPEEMICNGCASVKWCRYDGIRKCAQEKGIDNCGMCRNYTCEEIEKVFEQSESYAKLCKKNCSKEEYECFNKAFFAKREKLDNVHKSIDKKYT